MYEQVFLKDGPAARRSGWHQDSSYITVDGSHLAVVWIAFDDVPEEDGLELVPGSHRGPLYNTTRFDPDDETAPLFEGLPRLPDIEADRSAWDIVSWAVRPGDVIVFHPQVLHGGGATHDGRRRRTLSLRYFGQDATYVTRPRGRHRAQGPGARRAAVAGRSVQRPGVPGPRHHGATLTCVLAPPGTDRAAPRSGQVAESCLQSAREFTPTF